MRSHRCQYGWELLECGKTKRHSTGFTPRDNVRLEGALMSPTLVHVIEMLPGQDRINVTHYFNSIAKGVKGVYKHA
jgi:hypothetical protein